MKRFISYAILAMASVAILTGCYEYDDNELRPVQTYQVDVETQGNLSNADQASLMIAMVSHSVDTLSMNVSTNNLPELVKSMRLQLGEVSTATRIGFRLDSSSDRHQYVATILLAGFEQ